MSKAPSRYEARYRSEGPGEDEAKTKSRRRRSHGYDRQIPRQGSRLLPRPQGQVCCVETSKGRVNTNSRFEVIRGCAEQKKR